MCKKNKIEQPPYTDRTVVGIVVGDYPGYENDLEGPPEDAKDFRAKVQELWSDMNFREFKDREATASRFLSELTEGTSHVGEDGMLFVIMDNCFSESNTRNGRARSMRRNNVLRGIGYDRVLAFSASRDEETAADAVFNNKANGAWHYCLIKTLARGIIYLEWFNNAVALLKKLGFKQNPVIEGPLELQNRLVFEGNVITMEISSHGGQIYDTNGDEADGKDEVIYFYDKYVTDDQIRKILDKIDKRISAKRRFRPLLLALRKYFK
jgi:hypothetical protein